jgi:hypothetical protein
MRRAFGVTPKGVGGSIALRHMLTEFCFFAGNLMAAVAGVAQMVPAGPSVAYAINTLWAAYHAFMLSVLFFHLNRPVMIPQREPVFAVAA